MMVTGDSLTESSLRGPHASVAAIDDALMMRLRIDQVGRRGGTLMASPGRVVAARAHVADRARARLVGMLGTPDPGRHEAVVLVPCAAVHGVGLRSRIGAVFVDRHGRVLRVVDPLPRRGASCRGAHAVIEAASGVLALAPGDRVWLTGARLFPHGGLFRGRSGGRMPAPRALSGHREHTAPPHDRRTS
ncbi:MAG: hypothetical protein FJW92_08435 [Actinobacteria bacterium]|nr:hypothetical protein [Actinomycetota bacterium]